MLFIPGNTRVWNVPICTLGDIAELGPDRRDIYDGFTLTDTPTPYSALWGHRADEITTVAADPNRWLSPLNTARPNRPLRPLRLLWPRAGRIMLAERLRLNTQRLAAVMLPDPGLSNVWWPTRLNEADVRKEKALALWINSTLGLLLMIGHRVPTEGPWVQFKKPTLLNTPVLDVTSLSDAQLDELGSAYDNLAHQPLEPFHSMASDPARQDLDRTLRHVLGLPDFRSLSLLLAQEPVVSNHVLAALPLAEEEASEQLTLYF